MVWSRTSVSGADVIEQAAETNITGGDGIN
jgi:hypothetical protein